MTAQKILAKLLQAYDLTIHEYKDWILVNEQLPAISASTQAYKEYETGVGIRLDINVLVGEKKVIRESFTGIGKDELSATQNSFQNFIANSFPVFLAAFWQIENGEHIGIEKWDIEGSLWNAYIGNFGCKGDFNIPPELFKMIEVQIQEENLMENMYWFQFYYANMNENEKMFETLKNNENWPALQNIVNTIHWDISDKFYSLRNFIIIKRT